MIWGRAHNSMPKLNTLLTVLLRQNYKDEEFVKKNYILNNMKNVVKLAQETRKKNARPTDDRRSLVQSIVIASIPSTQQRLNAKERQLTFPSSTEIAKFLGLNPSGKKERMD